MTRTRPFHDRLLTASETSMPPRSHVLLEANYRQLLADPPNVAILPWGATEAHNWHLPHGTDVIEATSFAEAAAEIASGKGARPIVLPTIPFGNNGKHVLALCGNFKTACRPRDSIAATVSGRCALSTKK